MNEIDELQTQTNNYYYQSGLTFNKTQEGINQNYLVAYSQAEMQLRRDLAQLNQTIDNGNIAGESLVNQGFGVKVAGMNQMAQAALDAAKSYAMGKVGNGLSKMPSGEIKEIQGTYNNDTFGKNWKHKSFDLKGFGGIGGING